LRHVYTHAPTAHSVLCQVEGKSMWSLCQGQGDNTCGLWQLTLVTVKPTPIGREASDKIKSPICADYDNWGWALMRQGQLHETLLTWPLQLYMLILKDNGGLWQESGDSMGSHLYDQGGNMCAFFQLTKGTEKSKATTYAASDMFRATTLTTNLEVWLGNAIAHVISATWSIVQLQHTWLHNGLHKHSCYHHKSTQLGKQSKEARKKYYHQFTVYQVLILRCTYTRSSQTPLSAVIGVPGNHQRIYSLWQITQCEMTI